MNICRDFKRNYLGRNSKFIQGHGQLRILACNFNCIHKTAFMNIVVMIVCISNIVSTYSLVIGFQQKSFGIARGILFLITAINSMAAIVTLFGEASSVKQNSVKVLKRISKYHAINGRSLAVRKRRYIAKHLKSWLAIRVEFFSSNYFDRLTPLNLILFCVQNTVNLVLLGR